MTTTPTDMDETDVQELIEERAAIQQYDGGLSRHEAEREARKSFRECGSRRKVNNTEQGSTQ